MFPKIKSPYRRAAFWTAVLVLIASAAIYPSTKDTFMLDGHGALYNAGFTVLWPGAFLGAEITSIAMRLDPRDSIVISLNGLYWLRFAAPVFSWLIYFALLSLIIRIRARRAAKKV